MSSNNSNFSRNRNGNGFNRNNRNFRGRRFDRNRRFGGNKSDQRNNNNPMVEEQIAPIEYIPKKNVEKADKSDDKLSTNTMNVPKADGTTFKKKIPIYRTGSDERFLQVMETIRNLITNYAETTDNDHIAQTIADLGECFAGPAKSTFNRIVRTNAPTEVTLAEDLWEFTEEILPDNAYDDQCEYLRSTKKPMGLTSKDWIQRIEEINSYLSIMDENGASFTNDELIKQVIKPNIPTMIKEDFDLQYYDGMDLKTVAKKIGLLIKAADKRKVNNFNKGKNKGRSNDRRSRDQNYQNNDRTNDRGNNNRNRNRRNEENHQTSRGRGQDRSGRRNRSRSEDSAASSNRINASDSEEGYNIEEINESEKRK